MIISREHLAYHVKNTRPHYYYVSETRFTLNPKEGLKVEHKTPHEGWICTEERFSYGSRYAFRQTDEKGLNTSFEFNTDKHLSQRERDRILNIYVQGTHDERDRARYEFEKHVQKLVKEFNLQPLLMALLKSASSWYRQ